MQRRRHKRVTANVSFRPPLHAAAPEPATSGDNGHKAAVHGSRTESLNASFTANKASIRWGRGFLLGRRTPAESDTWAPPVGQTQLSPAQNVAPPPDRYSTDQLQMTSPPQDGGIWKNQTHVSHLYLGHFPNHILIRVKKCSRAS